MKEPFEINFPIAIFASLILSPVFLYFYYYLDSIPLLLLGCMGCTVFIFSSLYQFYSLFYFHSKKFKSIKQNVGNDVEKLNKFNRYLESLKYTEIHKSPPRQVKGVSKTKFQRYNGKIIRQDYYKPYEYRCSSKIVQNARFHPFKYICKYFGYKDNEKHALEVFQSALNNYYEIEAGIPEYFYKRDAIVADIAKQIPSFIQVFTPRKLLKKLDIVPLDQTKDYFPKFSFAYRSPAGNSMDVYIIRFDVPTIESFIRYLNGKIIELQSAKKQRSLLTRRLRQLILERDNYTCQICGNSRAKEPHLNLHIDHIKSVSKGGKTEESNLQVLCWECNLKKSSK